MTGVQGVGLQRGEKEEEGTGRGEEGQGMAGRTLSLEG